MIMVAKKEGGPVLEKWKNAAGKRVCDISEDHRYIEIVQSGYVTRITANPDGTLLIENFDQKKVA